MTPSAPPAQLGELFLMKRVRRADCHSDLAPIFDRHHVGTIIGISSESLSASVRNRYRHRLEAAPVESRDGQSLDDAATPMNDGKPS
jgi:hypothetical protein